MPNAESVKAQLKNIAREANIPFNLLLLRYGSERVLERISRSKHAHSFILKGASVFIAWKGFTYRTTRDIDLLGFGDSSVSEMKKVFKDILTVEIKDEPLVFNFDSFKVEAIKIDDDYKGVCVSIQALLDRTRIPIKIDIGFGDAVYPEAKEISYPALLSEDGIILKAYTIYTSVAEKAHASATKGLTNSRLKDFYDLLVVARDFNLEGDTLALALAKTFERRADKLPTSIPEAYTEEYYLSTNRVQQWDTFKTNSELTMEVGTLEDTIHEVAEFILPALMQKIDDQNWQPNTGWV